MLLQSNQFNDFSPFPILSLSKMATRPNAHKLKVFTDQEIKDALIAQKGMDWSLYSERELLENVIAQRVNFLVASYALFITAAAAVKRQEHLSMVFFLALCLLGLLSLAIYRVYIRLDVVNKMLYKADDNHVLPMVQKEILALGSKAFRNANPLIGKWIPIFCICTMAVGLLLSCIHWINVPPCQCQ